MAGHTRDSQAAPLLRFLGSMRLAIILLVAVGVASIIGTIIPQARPFEEYLVQFGPFWFEVYRIVGLFQVYTSGWYLGLLVFLVGSVAVCLYRQTPGMVREMRQFRENQRERSLRALRNHRELAVDAAPEEAEAATHAVLHQHGYRVRADSEGETRLLAAMRGRSNRLGYVFTHLAVVVIGVGALIDGNLLLRVQEWTGHVQVASEQGPVADMDSASRLPVDSGAFRGIVTIPEGERASVVYMARGDGVLVRELPFMLEVEAFRVEHYPSGEPRSFESDVVLHAPELDEPLRETIAVNKPLHYGGYSIYQANFGDGGSQLRLDKWDLLGGGEPRQIEARIPRGQRVEAGGRSYTLEPMDFAVHNVESVPGQRADNRNLGPSFTYRLRAETGEQREFEVYMLPAELDDGTFFIAGVRNGPAEPFRYLHIPADRARSPGTFLRLHGVLRQREQVQALAREAVPRVLADADPAPDSDSPVAPALARLGELLVADLLSEGPGAAQAGLEQRLAAANLPEEQQALWRELAWDVLTETVEQAYRQAVEQGGDDAPESLSSAAHRFLEHSLETLPAVQRYGAPVYLQPTDFEQRQATGLEVARTPGKPVVYTGFALLTAGLVLMFYVSHRRVWCRIRPDGAGSAVLIAANSPRDPLGLQTSFAAMVRALEARLGQGAPSRDE
ncbi:cytochrome c biogenesis protein ResB [Aquisalimonas asiatica]|uniref:Cytochrome c biogenesis protein n=1 Tax=Aquisalimonas asiatica TaxID=406100 RepID=A0A1H8PWQ7_9GAMM|nr:cytochrome c biogenesis protein ResB [Aquisalimonas asiatica]SEO46188.1 cytochrome c biogenesis protein [Aquisalimonas asiatica]